MKHKRLQKYVETLYPSFDYLGKTYLAEETLQGKHGNCMSLALLTSALANEVNVDLRYQRVNTRPIYRRYDNLLTLSSHVRSYLLDVPQKRENTITIFPARVVVDYYRDGDDIMGDMISEGFFFSMYYRNLASEAIIKDALPQAYALMYQALKIAPTDSENVSTMAVILNRLGHQDRALNLYELGAWLPESSLTLMTNFAFLLRKNGDTERAESILTSLGNAYEDNPYHWIDAAKSQANIGNYATAESMLKRAVEDAPYLHEAHFALAKLYFLTAKYDKANAAILQAQRFAYLPETRRLYTAKRSVIMKQYP